MEHENFHPTRPREQRQMRGRHGRSSDKGDARTRREKHARRLACATPAISHNHKLIERGLNGDRCGGMLAARVAELAANVDRAHHPVLRRTLYALDDLDSPLLKKYEAMRAIGFAVEMSDRWIRKPADHWPDPSKKEQGQLNAFLRHLFCAYRVPVPFNWAWANDDGSIFCAGGRKWFVHIGGGGSLRRARDLPYELSRSAAHAVMQARDDLTLPQAMRYGQLVGMGVDDDLARAAAMTQLGRSNGDNDVALLIGRWLARNGDVRLNHVQQIVDYVIGRRRGNDRAAAEPDFDIAGRNAGQVMRDIRRWHEELNRTLTSRLVTWASCGIGEFEQLVMNENGDAARWSIVELTSQQALQDEGRAMHHCVASFVYEASHGQCAIFALRRDDGTVRADGSRSVRHVATIEIELPARRIAQIGGVCNRQPGGEAMQIIRRWASEVGVSTLGPRRRYGL